MTTIEDSGVERSSNRNPSCGHTQLMTRLIALHIHVQTMHAHLAWQSRHRYDQQ